MPVSHGRIARVRAAAIAVLGALVMACATAAKGTSADAGAGTKRDVITAAQLTNTTATNVYDAIGTIRPELLTGRGLGAPDVYIHGMREPTGLERLRQLPVSGVEKVEYLRLEQARSLSGEQSQGGAIVVTLR